MSFLSFWKPPSGRLIRVAGCNRLHQTRDSWETTHFFLDSDSHSFFPCSYASETSFSDNLKVFHVTEWKPEGKIYRELGERDPGSWGLVQKLGFYQDFPSRTRDFHITRYMEIPSSGWKILIKSQFLDQPSTSGVSFSKLAIDFSFGFSLSNVEHLQVVGKRGFGRIGAWKKGMRVRIQKKVSGFPRIPGLV